MTIRAVVFDIGGVLEITPDLGVAELWETRLSLPAGELNQRMHDAWAGGGIGAITEDDVHQAITDRLGLDGRPHGGLHGRHLASVPGHREHRADRVRPPAVAGYRTGILSNSFVGAREREQAAYGFDGLVDEIVYSHEAGMSKPDPRIHARSCPPRRPRTGDGIPRRHRPVRGRRAGSGPPRGPLPRQRAGHRRDREAAHRPLACCRPEPTRDPRC